MPAVVRIGTQQCQNSTRSFQTLTQQFLPFFLYKSLFVGLCDRLAIVSRAITLAAFPAPSLQARDTRVPEHCRVCCLWLVQLHAGCREASDFPGAPPLGPRWSLWYEATRCHRHPGHPQPGPG